MSEKNLFKIIVSVLNVLVGVFVLAGSILIAPRFPDSQKIVLIIFGIAAFVITLITAIILDLSAGKYECVKCGHRFVPAFRAYVCGAHTLTRRYLKCPSCGEKSFCVRRIED